MTDNERDKTIAELRDIVTELIGIILDGQVEVQALEGVLIERHGLSSDVLLAYRLQVQQRRYALRAALASANPSLARWQGPPQARAT